MGGGPAALGTGPLHGVRVLDLTRLLPGGYCSLLLADLGADVVKVEEPGRGDYLRAIPPFVDGEGALHRALNRGKRSVTLDLKRPEGVETLRRLAGVADVLVESFRPGVMERLGVGHDALREANPRLVTCAITGYGQDGPYRDRAGHDVNYLGYGGVLAITGTAGGPPAIPGVQVGDLGGGGLPGAVGILAALWDRERTGRGRFVDVSMLDGVVSLLSIHAGAFLATHDEPERGRMPLSGGYAGYRVYRCADDRYLAVGAVEPRFWAALVSALGLPELEHEQDVPSERQADIAAQLEEIFATRPRAAWLAELEGLEACVGPVSSMSETFSDPQVMARGMVARVGGTPVGPASPLVFDGTRPTATRPAPRLGEHTDEILAQAGLRPDEIEDLRSQGVV